MTEKTAKKILVLATDGSIRNIYRRGTIHEISEAVFEDSEDDLINRFRIAKSDGVIFSPDDKEFLE